ncbi:MAG: hypothetical protein Q8R24_09505 [Legionellaceae bacterium]|nr:hypothetical protein [Legionellaceae bacterium]
MMDFLFINSQELTALMELPLIQRVTYIMGIRPYMDLQTCIVGIKRKISYQSLREVLYVAPIPGVKAEYPSHQQARRAVKSLERAGLVAIQSTEKNLILKCLLAETNNSVQNKAGTRPTSEVDTQKVCYTDVKSTTYRNSSRQADISKTAQADTPHNSENKYVCLSKFFENFWESYPQPQNKTHAWNEFQKLNPDEVLFSKIMMALDTQLNHHQQQQSAGLWVPHWRYPANWLAQRGWEDDINTSKLQEKTNATHKTRATKQPVDFFWESCKGGVDYIPDCETIADDSIQFSGNVIQFSERRKTSKAY